jgi:glycogen synthase kinase 3 beta
MPNGKDFPRLFDFTREGMNDRVMGCGRILTRLITELSVRPDLNRHLVPRQCEAELRARGIDLDTFVPIPLDQLKITLD